MDANNGLEPGLRKAQRGGPAKVQIFWGEQRELFYFYSPGSQSTAEEYGNLTSLSVTSGPGASHFSVTSANTMESRRGSDRHLQNARGVHKNTRKKSQWKTVERDGQQ